MLHAADYRDEQGHRVRQKGRVVPIAPAGRRGDLFWLPASTVPSRRQEFVGGE